MSDHVRILLRWLRYAEYVATWADIPLTERPSFCVRLIDDAWTAVQVAA